MREALSSANPLAASRSHSQLGGGSVTFSYSGVNDVTGNPKFVNPALDNEHLQSGSAALNTGVNAGVAADFDRQPRPAGPGFDIGYDEFYFNLYLPLVAR